MAEVSGETNKYEPIIAGDFLMQKHLAATEHLEKKWEWSWVEGELTPHKGRRNRENVYEVYSVTHIPLDSVGAADESKLFFF